MLTAKARVAPIKGISAVRSELCGAVMMSRLIDSVLQALPEKAARVTMIGDSEATIAALESRTASLAQYFGNRVAKITEKINTWGASSDIKEMMELEEVEEQTTIDKFYNIPGPQNVAHMATRA